MTNYLRADYGDCPSFHEIDSDGVTVWVNGPNGILGRFGRAGIDVHTIRNDGCLACTHGSSVPGWTTPEDWETFKALMRLHHNIVVTDKHKPARFDKPASTDDQ